MCFWQRSSETVSGAKPASVRTLFSVGVFMSVSSVMARMTMFFGC